MLDVRMTLYWLIVLWYNLFALRNKSKIDQSDVLCFFAFDILASASPNLTKVNSMRNLLKRYYEMPVYFSSV